jgi:hypothetical protein
MPSARILYLAIKDNDDERTGSEQPGRRSVSPSSAAWLETGARVDYSILNSLVTSRRQRQLGYRKPLYRLARLNVAAGAADATRAMLRTSCPSVKRVGSRTCLFSKYCKTNSLRMGEKIEFP